MIWLLGWLTDFLEGLDMDFKKVAIVAGLAFAIGFTVMIKLRPKPIPKPPPVLVTQQYPVAAMYSNIRGNGDPFVNTDGSIDTADCKEQARWDLVMMDPERRDNANRKALRYIRSMNDTSLWFAYVPTGGFYVCKDGYTGAEPPPYGCDTTQFTWQMMRLAQRHRAILYDRSGNPIMMATGVGVDFAQAGFPVALAALVVEWTNATEVFNPGGVFNDGPCSSIANWYPGNQTDYVRQGYETLADWDKAYTAGVNEYYEALRYALGKDRVIIGNCGPKGSLEANGWNGENHPYQNPYNWAAWDSLLSWADTAYTAKQFSFITTPRPRWQGPDGKWQVAPFSDPGVQRQFRFIVGSASLHDRASGIVVGSPFDPLKGFMPDQWHEWYYSFGSPLGPKQGTRRGFSNGTLVVNPTPARVKTVVGDSAVFVPPTDAMFVVGKW